MSTTSVLHVCEVRGLFIIFGKWELDLTRVVQKPDRSKLQTQWRGRRWRGWPHNFLMEHFLKNSRGVRLAELTGEWVSCPSPGKHTFNMLHYGSRSRCCCGLLDISKPPPCVQLLLTRFISYFTFLWPWLRSYGSGSDCMKNSATTCVIWFCDSGWRNGH